MSTCDIAILGAGPYGLAAAAHLKRLKGLEVRIFGEPMDFWGAHMPEGMFLRSPWAGSHISDPESTLTMDTFRDELRCEISKPIPLDKFVSYGLWFQKKAVPDLDRRRIARIDRAPEGFRLTLDDGANITARRVVVASGIGPFARRLPELSDIPPQFATHASDGRDVRRFEGKQVLVVGAGQSALESAALIHEAGGKVEVVVRAPAIHWLGWRSKLQKLGPIGKMLYSPADVGPAGVSRIVAFPNSVKYFPRWMQNRFRKRSLRPAGARWLMDRCTKIPTTTSSLIQSAKMQGDKVAVRLNDGSTRNVDHVLQGTGYKIEVSRYPFFAPELAAEIVQVDGFPKLKPGLESSVPGLYILGAPAAWTFGPLLFFVAGTEFAATNLARAISKETRSR